MNTSLPCTGGGSASLAGSDQYNARVVTSSPARRARSRHCGISSAPAAASWNTAARATSGPSSWARKVKSTTTPKFPPPPRIAQNRSGFSVVAGVDELARCQDDLSGEEIVTAQAPLPVKPTDATAERQTRRHRWSRPRPPGRPDRRSGSSRSTCPHVAPPWTRTVWLAGSTQTPFMSRRSSTRPPSTVPCPATWCPPAAHREQQPVLPSQVDAVDDVGCRPSTG